MATNLSNNIHYEDGLVLRSVIDDLVPEHVSHNYPALMYAVRKYADFLEHINGAGHFLNTLEHQRDIDSVESNLLYQLQKEIGAPIPQQFSADPRLLYKRVTEFYRSRGTPDSIKAFFRILFNDEVELYFPKEDMLIPSDGKYYEFDDVITNSAAYTPTFIYTIASDTNLIEGEDDSGRRLLYDNPIIFVNNHHRTDFKSQVVVNNTTSRLDYSLVFDTNLQTGDVVKIYRSGSFSNNDGFLDNYKKLQDSYFYQKFSYVLRTGANADDWKNAFARLVHPAGFIFFGEILLFLDNLGQTFPLIQPGFQIGGQPFPIIVPVVDAKLAFASTRTWAGWTTATGSAQPTVANQQYTGERSHFIEVSFKTPTIQGTLGAKDHWEQLKFSYTDPISQFNTFTFEDVINKKIVYNIDSVIEIS